MSRINIRSVFISICIFLALFLSFNKGVFAQICSGKDDCANKIKELSEKVSGLAKEENNLTSQIKIINTRADLTRAKIITTEQTITATEKEIDELDGKIERLNSSLDHLSAILLQKIVEGYKKKEATLFDVFLAPDTATLSNQLKYIQVAQDNDRRLALRTQQLKVNFSEQKDLRETKKADLQKLQNDLVVQKKDLDSQVLQEKVLLEQTKNDKQKYQQLLSQALAEFQAVNKAIENGQKVGDVKKGDPIALVGNTGYPGCSTGAHLHFEVRQNNQWIDPGGYVGSGKQFDMPLQEPITITQGYGVTPYSWRYTYSGGIHTGWDMISGSSDVIRAVGDGALYSSAQNCSGAVIKIKYIDHGGGLMTFYLHVQ